MDETAPVAEKQRIHTPEQLILAIGAGALAFAGLVYEVHDTLAAVIDSVNG